MTIVDWFGIGFGLFCLVCLFLPRQPYYADSPYSHKCIEEREQP